MATARNYWISTASSTGKPSATPVWGAWLDGKLYFDGSVTTRRGKNIQENSQVTVHLESGDKVVILEGEAIIYPGAPERDLADRLAATYRAKYVDQGYNPSADQWDQGGLFEFTPHKVIAWTLFPKDMTRWILD
jgi:general stress protein 26